MSAQSSKTVRIQDHPDYEVYVKIVRSYHEQKAAEIGIPYKEYIEKLDSGFEE